MGRGGMFGLEGPEVMVFGLALLAGTACSLASKVLLDMESVGMTGEKEIFRRPMAQVALMFLGMVSALGLHWAVKAFKIPFPGYEHQTGPTVSVGFEPKPSGSGLYFVLFFPAAFDLAATALCMYGLPHVDVSIYQMLRGSAIVFVALLKQFVLGDSLTSFMWIGVFWNVVSIVIVGLVALLNNGEGGEPTSGLDPEDKQPLLGVVLILAGAFVQSLQYAFEEKVLTMENSAPPLLLIGMEGFWGSVICLGVLYPAMYAMPGDDHGSLENPFNTMALILNNPTVWGMFIFYFVSIFLYNTLAVLVTYMLDSVWHAILDNFRPGCVWLVDLAIFYVITGGLFGEAWTKWSILELVGMGVLIYGTSIYNGSTMLLGQWYNCFINVDYDLEADTPLLNDYHNAPYMSPYMSPMLTPSRGSPISGNRDSRPANAGYGAIAEEVERGRTGSFGS